MTTRTVHTFCRYCLASCGLEVTVEDNRVVKIGPDKLNPPADHPDLAQGRRAQAHLARAQSPSARPGARPTAIRPVPRGVAHPGPQGPCGSRRVRGTRP
ncbi:hypothetical protein EJD98_27795 [Mycolicibacterium peregrinum]|uniref:Uncharacterized protein n=1 Tax=Mycolicibacterium peregrinum TaxID=43304 RepID=A0A4Z0HWG9_MYCPR|nr:hypothetical protein EJD98_27795 [Mycolicibacterium peregrinum]TGB46637.1 hypothetical protein EJD94_06875 [Mycolicibacterium peregrinum]